MAENRALPHQTQSPLEGKPAERFSRPWRVFLSDLYTRQQVDDMLRAVVQWVADNFQPALYGSMDGIDVIPAISSGWSPIDEYDTPTIPPRGVTFDPVAGTFAVDYEGVYHGAIFFYVEHNESNQSRTFDLRLYNVTKGTAQPGVTIGIGRNQPITMATFVLPLDVAAADKGDEYRLETGNTTDSITILSDMVSIDITMVSEWSEAIFDPRSAL